MMKVQSMKKLMACFTVVASVVTATAQGTLNANNNYVPSGATDKAFVIGFDGKPASVEYTRVAICEYWGASDKGGEPVGGTVLGDNLLTPGNRWPEVQLTLPGIFFINDITIPKTTVGGTGQVLIRAWDNRCTENRYENAEYYDFAIVTINNLGGGIMPPATLALNSDFRGLDLRNRGSFIPEPSTYALMALGLIGVFFINKRK